MGAGPAQEEAALRPECLGHPVQPTMWVKPPRTCLREKAGQLSRYLPLPLYLSQLYSFDYGLVLDSQKNCKDTE